MPAAVSRGLAPSPDGSALVAIIVLSLEIRTSDGVSIVPEAAVFPGVRKWLRWRKIPRWRQNRWQETRSEEHTSELQSLMRISYADFCLKKTNIKRNDSVIM